VEKQTYLDLLAQHSIDSAHPGGLGMTKTLLARETITSDMVLLDVGCGTGQTTLFIAEHYPCRVVAVDINQNMLDKASRKFTESGLRIPLFRADATALPFRRDAFDIVLAESVTIFTSNIDRTLREYYRVLKPGGKLLAIEGTALSPLEKEEAGDLKEALGITLLPTKEQWCRMLTNTGFSDVKVLYHQRMSKMGAFPFQLTGAFHEYRNIMFRFRKKFGFGVYRCTL
jgi:Methylase involved in ubiquinone/menaquinone biosynthesis